MAVSGSFALLLLAAFTVIPTQMFRQEPKFRDDYSLTFSQAGIHFKTADIDSLLQWSMYARALVDDCSYVLYYGPRRFSVVPKRVFQSEEQRRVFDHMLTEHVPVIVRRGTETGSPDVETNKA